MGVSFHQAVRRFEGRESATTGLSWLSAPAAEPSLNAGVRNRMRIRGATSRLNLGFHNAQHIRAPVIPCFTGCGTGAGQRANVGQR